MKILFKKLNQQACTPEYKTPGSAAFDLALIDNTTIPARSFVKIRTGLVIATPKNHVLLLMSRSSNPVKKGIDLANSVGIIDSDYCGPDDELFLVIENITDSEVKLHAGDRIAQGMFVPVTTGAFVEVADMTAKNRGGHGSTGT